MRRLVLGGTYLHYYDYECKENPKYCDDKSIVSCLYNNKYQAFITASGNNVKVYINVIFRYGMLIMVLYFIPIQQNVIMKY